MAIEVMKTPKEPKPVTLADVPEPELHNPIAEPKKLAQLFIESGRTLATAYAAARTVIIVVAPDMNAERARFELLVNQRGPDWSFTTTGNQFPVSSQLLRMAEQAAYTVLAYISALTSAEHLLDETRGLIERAERYHAERRELATSVPDIELLELYFTAFTTMKAERSKLLGLVTVEYEKKLPIALANACAIRLARAATEVGVSYDVARAADNLKRIRANLEAFRGAAYPVNDRIAALEQTLKPLLPKGQKLVLPRQVWPNGDSDPFSPPTMQ
jgi:hypothetical protein